MFFPYVIKDGFDFFKYFFFVLIIIIKFNFAFFISCFIGRIQPLQIIRNLFLIHSKQMLMILIQTFKFCFSFFCATGAAGGFRFRQDRGITLFSAFTSVQPPTSISGDYSPNDCRSTLDFLCLFRCIDNIALV